MWGDSSACSRESPVGPDIAEAEPRLCRDQSQRLHGAAHAAEEEPPVHSRRGMNRRRSQQPTPQRRSRRIDLSAATSSSTYSQPRLL